ncbi:MAG TPA: sulfotransferase [Trebonia sp.]|nr:sulfotransferase [Trebonia sp.]
MTGPQTEAPILDLDEPVVVLTCARAGSTLLRFLLDAHPALACPPETNLVKAAVLLGSNWRMLNEWQGDLPTGPTEIIRSSVDGVLTDYLTRRGRRRWCDKSLGTAEVAEQFTHIYPKAKFICLYRHCMDVIASGIEACPWGVSGHGFEPYVSNNPGNNVAALAHYWADYTTAILEFEEAHADSCLRVRYEDLTFAPAETASRIFGFLGVEDVPGIAESCLTAPHERSGPADYKIWTTFTIKRDSVGRGTAVPIEVIPGPLLGVINTILGRLDYAVIGDDWNVRPPAPLPPGPDGGPASPADSAELTSLGEILAGRLESTLPALRHQDGDPRALLLTVHAADDAAQWRHWRIDLEQARVAGPLADDAGADLVLGPGDWRVAADSETLSGILSGLVNLSIAIRQGRLRCIRAAPVGPAQDTRLQVMARLLGADGQ